MFNKRKLVQKINEYACTIKNTFTNNNDTVQENQKPQIGDYSVPL